MLCGATNPSIDVVRGKLIPGTYLMENFKSLIANQIWGWPWPSFRNAILMTFITLLVCSIAGYALRSYRDKAKDALMSVLAAGHDAPPFVAIMIPLFKMMSTGALLTGRRLFCLHLDPVR